MLKQASRIHIGRQKKFKSWVPSEENRAEIMALAMGRSGGLRAPTLKSGNDFFIGFCEGMYLEYI